MEACTFGLVFRPIQDFSGGVRLKCDSFSKTQLVFRPWKQNESYNGVSSIRCDGEKEDMTMRKKLKVLKGLYRNLSLYSEMDIGRDGSVDDSRNMLTQLSRFLLSELQQNEVKKEIKRRKKQEKRKLKVMTVKPIKKGSDSLSSSSGSSNNKYDKVVDKKVEDERKQVHVEAGKVDVIDGDHSPISSKQKCIASNTSRAENSNCAVAKSFAERIDVCMGSKCKKYGAEALLKEVDRKIGVEGVVAGCKCMGKCKSAPNVRVSSNKYFSEGMANSVTAPSNALYVGVGLEDATLYMLE